jgi:hypothetical protein
VTVIACNLREMAAESLCHEDDGSFYYAAKMVQLEDGTIVGGAGNKPEGLIDWLVRGANPMDKPHIDPERDDFTVVHLTHNGIVLYINQAVPIRLKEKNYAVGCGADVALYVMRVLKKSPATAVREASKINMYCGGEIDVMKLKVKRG